MQNNSFSVYVVRRRAMSLRRFCLESIAITCLIAPVAPGWAQTYPARPVRYIVPSLPGGGSDILGRMVAGSLAQSFGQQVIVDNRAGGGGNIGAEIAAKAAPDGHTLFQMAVTHTINVSLYRNLAYDLVRDFSPVS
jgi:tripartite-type tricarboxylate transporter receptor subunit TctC